MFADELAEAIIAMFYGAEKGKHRLERLVLSGHSNGIELWGERTRSQEGGTIVLSQDLEGGHEPVPAGRRPGR